MTRVEIQTAVQTRVGPDFSLEVFQKALAKAKRWVTKAMGGMDWSEMDADRVLAFYQDTIKNPSGRRTFNRGF